MAQRNPSWGHDFSGDCVAWGCASSLRDPAVTPPLSLMMLSMRTSSSFCTPARMQAPYRALGSPQDWSWLLMVADGWPRRGEWFSMIDGQIGFVSGKSSMPKALPYIKLLTAWGLSKSVCLLHVSFPSVDTCSCVFCVVLMIFLLLFLGFWLVPDLCLC